MKTFLITGVAGFIGNIAEYLLDQGYAVVGLDNLSSGQLKILNLLNPINVNLV